MSKAEGTTSLAFLSHLSKAPAGRERIREVNQAWAPPGDLDRSIGRRGAADRAFSCTLCVSKVKWMRQEELFLSFCSLCSSCLWRQELRGKMSSNQRHHTSFVSLSDKTLLLFHLLPEIAFCNGTLFLVYGRMLLRKDTKAEMCSLCCDSGGRWTQIL